MSSGTLYGVGVGPGDPELLTLKAARIVQTVAVIAYLAPPDSRPQARDIAAQWLTGQQRELPIPVSCRTDRRSAQRVYDAAAAALGEELHSGHDVAVLCEGDPLCYGSFTYLLQRLERFPCLVIPGVSSVNAVAAVAGRPLTAGAERLAVIPATAGEDAMRQALADYDSIVIMKPGRRRPQIVALLEQTGRLDDAVYVEQATRPEQRIVDRVGELDSVPGPYFSLFLVTRRGAR